MFEFQNCGFPKTFSFFSMSCAELIVLVDHHLPQVMWMYPASHLGSQSSHTISGPLKLPVCVCHQNLKFLDVFLHNPLPLQCQQSFLDVPKAIKSNLHMNATLKFHHVFCGFAHPKMNQMHCSPIYTDET